MARIATRLVLVHLEITQQGMRHRGGAAGSDERLQRPHAGELDELGLGERVDERQPALPQEHGVAVVLVGESVDVEAELVAPRLGRPLWQSSVPQSHLTRVGAPGP